MVQFEDKPLEYLSILVIVHPLLPNFAKDRRIDWRIAPIGFHLPKITAARAMKPEPTIVVAES